MDFLMILTIKQIFALNTSPVKMHWTAHFNRDGTINNKTVFGNLV